MTQLVLAAMMVASLAACSNGLVEAVRDHQAQAVSPKLTLTLKSDGSPIQSGGSLSFGAVSVGGAVSRELVIANAGETDLVIRAASISISPAHGTGTAVFQALSSSDLTLEPQATATLTLGFSPAADQDYGATLSIASNDLAQGTFSCTLSGTGLGSAKVMTSFSIQSPLRTGVIDEAAKTIAVTVPFDTTLNDLVAGFSDTGTQVRVGAMVQSSGVTHNDFSSPVVYTVVAQDGSTADYTVTVTPVYEVPSLTTDALLSITASTATGSGRITSTGGKDVTETGICWSTSETPTISDSKAAGNATTGNFAANLTGLGAGNTYYVRAFATNSVGTGYGNQVSFITLPAAPTVSSVLAVRGAAGSNKLAVGWGAVTGASTYTVYASETNSLPASAAQDGSDVTGTSCTISGLSNYKNYYVWVVAANGSGKGGAGTYATSVQVGVPVASVTIKRVADNPIVSSGRTTDTLMWDSTHSTSSTDGLFAVVSPSDATNTSVTWSSTGGVSVTTDGIIALASASAGTVKATPADGQGGTAATVAVSVISHVSGATNYVGPSGGTIFYDKGSYSNGWRYLETQLGGANRTGYSITPSAPWCPSTYYLTAIGTSTDLGTGKENTDKTIATCGTASSYLARSISLGAFSANGGFYDWFLPSKGEVESILAVIGNPLLKGLAFATSSESSSTYFWDYSSGTTTDWSWKTLYKSNSPSFYPVRRF